MPTPKGKEKELTDPPFEKDEKEELEEIRKRMDVMLKYEEDLAILQSKLDMLSHDVEYLTFHSPSLLRAQSKVKQDPLEAARSNDGEQEINRLKSGTQNLLHHNGTGDITSDKRLEWNAKNWCVFFGIVITAGVGIIFEEIVRQGNKKSDADIPTSEEVKEKIKKMVFMRANENENDFWKDVAQFAEENKLNLADMVYFTQYIQSTFPLTEQFLWNKLQDKTDIVNLLKNEYRKENSITALFILLPTITYNNSPLPRCIAASCAQLAMSDLANALDN
ncbi:hypothetical protein [Priestia sp. YIM B13448]|uniref:hypothetical protein n=1 Tax=Priestia sp. YIM B13448 TaxID=3366308 RepID=UPI003670FBD6